MFLAVSGVFVVAAPTQLFSPPRISPSSSSSYFPSSLPPPRSEDVRWPASSRRDHGLTSETGCLASVTHAHAHTQESFCLRGWKIWAEDVRPGAALSARRVSRTDRLRFCWRLIDLFGGCCCCFFGKVFAAGVECLLCYLRSRRRSLSHVGVLLNFCLLCYIRSESPVIEQTSQLMVQISRCCPSEWQTNCINAQPTDLLERVCTVIINV